MVVTSAVVEIQSIYRICHILTIIQIAHKFVDSAIERITDTHLLSLFFRVFAPNTLEWLHSYIRLLQDHNQIRLNLDEKKKKKRKHRDCYKCKCSPWRRVDFLSANFFFIPVHSFFFPLTWYVLITL